MWSAEFVRACHIYTVPAATAAVLHQNFDSGVIKNVRWPSVYGSHNSAAKSAVPWAYWKYKIHECRAHINVTAVLPCCCKFEWYKTKKYRRVNIYEFKREGFPRQSSGEIYQTAHLASQTNLNANQSQTN